MKSRVSDRKKLKSFDFEARWRNRDTVNLLAMIIHPVRELRNEYILTSHQHPGFPGGNGFRVTPPPREVNERISYPYHVPVP